MQIVKQKKWASFHEIRFQPNIYDFVEKSTQNRIKKF